MSTDKELQDLKEKFKELKKLRDRWAEERNDIQVLLETTEDEQRLIWLGWYEALGWVLSDPKTCEVCDKEKYSAYRREDNINVCELCNKIHPNKK